MPNWNQNPGPPATTQGTGGYAKGVNQNPPGKAPRTDHGGKVYQDSGWDLKPNGRSLSGNMPLLSGFTRYGVAAKRWAKMLYNHALCSWVVYIFNNLKGDKNSLTGKNAVVGNRRK